MGLTKIIDSKIYVYFAPIATPLLQLTGVKTVPKLSSGLPSALPERFPRI
jgi:hypothetical protein